MSVTTLNKVTLEVYAVEHAEGPEVTEILDADHADELARSLGGRVRAETVTRYLPVCECGWNGNPTDDKPGAASQRDYHQATHEES